MKNSKVWWLYGKILKLFLVSCPMSHDVLPNIYTWFVFSAESYQSLNKCSSQHCVETNWVENNLNPPVSAHTSIIWALEQLSIPNNNSVQPNPNKSNIAATWVEVEVRDRQSSQFHATYTTTTFWATYIGSCYENGAQETFVSIFSIHIFIYIRYHFSILINRKSKKNPNDEPSIAAYRLLLAIANFMTIPSTWKL